jgi:hypothetical protein
VFPQNKISCFKDECKYTKYMVLTIFLFMKDLIVLIATNSLLNLTIKFSTDNPNLNCDLARLPKILLQIRKSLPVYRSILCQEILYVCLI